MVYIPEMGGWEPQWMVGNFLPYNVWMGSPQIRVTRLRGYAVTRIVLYK